MIKLENIKTVYFLGIGGIGMSALARYFNLHGCAVSGYDKTRTPLTQKLESEGIQIHYTPNVHLIPDHTDLVIYTPAIPQDHEEWSKIVRGKLPLMKRAEVLGLISNGFDGLAVAGTHGKTTTSAILAHIMQSYFGEVNAFVGGILSNYNTNFLFSEKSKFYVLEADEFDRSFLHLTPKFGVINSVDADHLDIYGEHNSLITSFKDFAKKIRPEGKLIIKSDLAGIFSDVSCSQETFGIDKTADYSGQNIRVEQGKFIFDLKYPNGIISNLSLALPGKHNIENAIAASAVALSCGVSEAGIIEAISSFTGVKRRFEISGSFNHTIYVDDYAHHPTEISRVLEAGRELYPNKRLSVIFQPHLYSRTRDFENEFAQALSGFDEIMLLDIYPARELPIPGVTSENLLDKIASNSKCVLHKEDVVSYLENKEFDVLFTLGAGDIDTLVEPIKELVVA